MHYLVVKKLWALLRGITSKHHGIFIAWIIFIVLQLKTNVNFIKSMWKERFFNFIMPSKDTAILEFNQYKKSDKVSFIIYAGVACLTEKINGCKINPDNSFTT